MELIDTSASPYADAAKVNANFAEVEAAIDGLSATVTDNFNTLTAAVAGIVDHGTSDGIPEIVDARKFGVKVDNIDYTDEFAAAYEAACDVKGTLVVPGGVTLISGLDLGGAAHKGCTIEGASYDGRGNGWKSSRILLSPGSNRPLFKLLPGDAPHQIFRRLVLDGNASNQTANEYIVKSEDDLTPATYPYGFHMEFVHFTNGRGGGLYLGKRRGWNYLNNVIGYMNGAGNSGHGIYIDTYDVTMNHVNIGNSYGYNLYLASTSQLEANATNLYFGGLGGMYVGEGVTDFAFTNGSIDRNLRYGVNTVKNSNAVYKGGRSFVGTRFLGNSSIGDGQFPDVMVGNGDKDLMFSACSFMGADTANRSAYAIQFGDTLGSVKIGPCKFAPAASFRWGVVGNTAQVITDNRIS